MKKAKLQIKDSEGNLLSESDLVFKEGDTLIATTEGNLTTESFEDLRIQPEKVSTRKRCRFSC